MCTIRGLRAKGGNGRKCQRKTKIMSMKEKRVTMKCLRLRWDKRRKRESMCVT